MHGLSYMSLTITYDAERLHWVVSHRGTVIAEGLTLGSIREDAAEIERTLERRWRHSTQEERKRAR